MLHRINPPDAECQAIFSRILSFQRQVLAFACDPATTLPLTEAVVLAEFGAAGEWFWKQLHAQSGKNTGAENDLHRALESVIRYVRSHPGLGSVVLDSFDHDIDFPAHIDDPAFQFAYNTTLDNTARDALKALMVAFYEDMLCAGFPSVVHGAPTTFDRDALVRSFWAANPEIKVCPACDAQRPDSIGDKNYSDVDHYLPKSSYSVLSVHPTNLVPVCQGCNRSFKLTRDPIDLENDAPLVNIFVPYLRPALDFVAINTRRLANGPLQFSIIDVDGTRSRRVENLDRTFQLEERWCKRADQVKDSVREALSGARRIMLKHEIIPREVDLQVELEEVHKERTALIGKNYNYVLHASYLTFAANDQDEFEELYRQFEGR